jgi:hypothetical protein
MRQGKGMVKRDRKAERAARYKRAFDEVIGDPYAYPEPIEGHYSMLKRKSTISVVNPEPKSKAPVNKAKPTAIDFFIDVDKAILEGLEVFNQHDLAPVNDANKLIEVFNNTYFAESGTIFVQTDRANLEQIIGCIFVARHISPTTRYFTTIKR